MNLISHYKKLLYFNTHRMEGDNYRIMREYFAKILIDDVEKVAGLRGKKILDVGGAKGEFCGVLSAFRGCDAVNLDIKLSDPVWNKNVEAEAYNIPFADNEFDFVMCRGVMEHIEPEKQQRSVNEMYRVTKHGGICYIMIPPWYNPHAGHTFRPFHIFGFRAARFLARRLYNKKIDENSFAERSLYKITFSRMAKMIKTSGFEIAASKDVHLRMHFITKIPLVREVAVPAVGFILVKK